MTIEVDNGTLTLSNTVGSEFDINNFVVGDQESPQVAIAENGNYIVVWQSNGQDGSGLGVYAQLFNAEGISTGPEFLVNESTAGHQQDPSVDMDRNGNFVIVWTGKGDAAQTVKPFMPDFSTPTAMISAAARSSSIKQRQATKQLPPWP